MNLREISRLFYQLKLTHQETQAIFEKETGFSLTRYELLMTVNEKGSCLQNEIQQEMQIDSAAITRQLKILEEKGYVKRTRNSANNREIFVELTDSSRAALASCEQDHQQEEQDVLLNLTQAETKQLLELLAKITPKHNKKED